MTTIIVLDGGVGRVIASIPALLKYHKNHPDEEWYVTVYGWDFVMWGIPELQDRTFNPDSKGVFDLFLKADRVISPEPYRVPSYYRNEISLAEAFDFEINGTTDHSDLPAMKLNLSNAERRLAYEVISDAKKIQGKEKTVVIQPYGSTATAHPSGPYDDSLRSIPKNMLDYLVSNLTKDYNVIYMGPKELGIINTCRPEPDPNLREWAAIIEAADYFIGCDSCGQHMCKALNKKASVVIAGTHKVNVTYKDFHIIERNVPFYFESMRISGFHSHLATRLNEERAKFTEEEMEKAYGEIVSKIEGECSKREECDSVKVEEKKVSYKKSSLNIVNYG